MSLGVVFYFDDESNKIIREIWQRLCDKGICSEMLDTKSIPHISIASFDSNRITEIIDRAEQFSRTIRSFKLNLTSIGCFPGENGIVYLAPKVTSEFLDVHNSFYEYYKDEVFYPNQLYMPDKIVPHCTMTINVDRKRALMAVDMLMDECLPFEVTITAIGFAEYYPIKYLQDYTIYLK